ncbi:MAG: DUF6687 family protein [Acidimicrobiales bacterium]
MTARRGAPQFVYVPYDVLDGRRHVVVDGAPRPGTVTTLSHWPMAPTPPQYAADTSAEIVLRALDDTRWMPEGVDVATVDHYDADGTIALALLVIPGLAGTHRNLLVDASHAGDFDVVRSRGAGAVAFALESLGRAHEALALLPSLADDPGEHEHLWHEQMTAYEAALDMRREGAIVIEEEPDLDLAVVRVDTRHPCAQAARWGGDCVHLGAVHSATERLRIATIAGGRFELRYRYESWVRMASRTPRPRVELDALAAQLSAAESDGGSWHAENVRAITPSLSRRDGESSTLDEKSFLGRVRAALRAGDTGAGETGTADTGA